MNKFISYNDIPAWLNELSRNATVFAPLLEGQMVLYRPYKDGDTVELSRRSAESAKHIIFPRTDELFSFTKHGNDVELHEPAEPGSVVAFGVLGCDARGFMMFDPVYKGSGTKGKAMDTYYLKRREKTAIIVKACKSATNSCFCNWVGGSPVDKSGADILATDVKDGLLLQSITNKGEALLSSNILKAATDEHAKIVDTAHKAAMDSMPPIPELGKAQEAILSLFGNMEFWQDQSAACISCGTCSFLCPTCYCFGITDESNGITGTRIRTWDNCMSALFTLEASGHNPRSGKAHRLKNRVSHKFSYYPDLYDGRFACCGCGRCIKSCPASIDIRSVVLNTIKENANV